LFNPINGVGRINLIPGCGFLNPVRVPGKFACPLMLHDLGAGPRSAAAKIVSDVMESCRNEGSILPFHGQAATPGDLIRGDITRKISVQSVIAPILLSLKTYLEGEKSK